MKQINSSYACKMLNLELPSEQEIYHARQKEKYRDLINAYNRGEIVYTHNNYTFLKGGENNEKTSENETSQK
jgi:hypothetical protein